MVALKEFGSCIYSLIVALVSDISFVHMCRTMKCHVVKISLFSGNLYTNIFALNISFGWFLITVRIVSMSSDYITTDGLTESSFAISIQKKIHIINRTNVMTTLLKFITMFAPIHRVIIYTEMTGKLS